MKRIVIILLIFVRFFSVASNAANNKIGVLILSGRNNHDWKETTPVLKRMYMQSGLFKVTITMRPDTLKSTYLQNFDVVVSNWTSFPDKSCGCPVETKSALTDFIKKGGGFVTFHAATTGFYDWPEFKQISTGAWLKGTKHGHISATEIQVVNSKHPITKGMASFFIEDELWINAGNNPTFDVLGTGTNSVLKNKNQKSQPAIMVKEFGKGRIFHTILGHDARAMRNIGFQTLLLRATEWAASGKVKQKLPQQLRCENKTAQKFKWLQTDSTFALLNGKNVVWQYNFREIHQKPHFNPVFVGRNNITCVSPSDHPWHAGQWFSWKYINHVNYWEYVNKDEFRSEGITEIRNIKWIRNPDFSAEIMLDIDYHPANGENVLSEKRTINISAPNLSGEISMDYRCEFKAVAERVELDRTPIEGEPNGKVWGGYGGLSIRFNQSFMNPKIVSPSGVTKMHGQKSNWLAMEFTGIDGAEVGSQIIIPQNSKRDEAAWYVTINNDLPFYYFSPAYLFEKPVGMQKGENLVLNYRVIHFNKNKTKRELEEEYQKYINQQR